LHQQVMPFDSFRQPTRTADTNAKKCGFVIRVREALVKEIGLREAVYQQIWLNEAVSQQIRLIEAVYQQVRLREIVSQQISLACNRK